MKKRIVIIGGSIAGNTMAILLQRVGFEVTVLERSSGVATQGSGITLPITLVEQCINIDLFDKNIPTLNMTSRSFSRKEIKSFDEAATFWTQPINALALNWLHVYENLHKRIPKESYHHNTTVQDISKVNNIFYVKTSKNITYEADFVIAADGVDSLVRQIMFPKIQPQYAGYIAWRGFVECKESYCENITTGQVPYFVFKEGHILLYRIPGRDYLHNQKNLLNWVMYEKCEKKYLDELLRDKFGKLHSKSLPQGFLSDEHIKHLHELAKRVLPFRVADLIMQTQRPFIQAIFDLQLPVSPDYSLIFSGDSAATYRPHSSSGVYKALTSAINLYNLFKTNEIMNFVAIISKWQENEQIVAGEESKKSISMGEALVKRPPDWNQLNQESTDTWWNSIMQGKAWYVTKDTDIQQIKPQYHPALSYFKPVEKEIKTHPIERPLSKL